MSQQIMRGLLEARLLTLGWASQTAKEGKYFKPTPSTPFQEVTTVFSEPEAITVAGSSQRRGIFQVRLLYPLNEVAADGIDTPQSRAEAIAALFPRNLVMSGAGANVLIAREAQITRGPPQGDRDVTIVRIRFRDR